MGLAPSIRSGWGAAALNAVVAQLVGGLNNVIPGVGIVIQIAPTGNPQRVTSLGWRVDLAPDQATGTLVSPVRWRCAVIAGQITDLTGFQQQAFPPPAARLEIPAQLTNSGPLTVLADNWLDFSAGAPGLNLVVRVPFNDGGPTVDGSTYLSAILCPIIDAAYPATAPNPAANQPKAQMYLEVFGCSANAGAFGGAADGPVRREESIPRYG